MWSLYQLSQVISNYHILLRSMCIQNKAHGYTLDQYISEMISRGKVKQQRLLETQKQKVRNTLPLDDSKRCKTSGTQPLDKRVTYGEAVCLNRIRTV